MIDRAAESSELGIVGVERAGGAEDHLPVNGSSGSDQFGLHVDAEKELRVAGDTLIGACDDDRLAGDVLVIEVDSGLQKCVKGERRLTGGYRLADVWTAGVRPPSTRLPRQSAEARAG